MEPLGHVWRHQRLEETFEEWEAFLTFSRASGRGHVGDVPGAPPASPS